MIFVTEYAKGECKWAGCEIEAESFEEAIALANQITSLEQQLQNPRFSKLTVLGTLEKEILFEADQAHAVAQMNCNHCLHHWVAVYPAATEFLNCPRCDRVNPVK